MIHFITVPDRVNGLNYSMINVADFINVTVAIHWIVSFVYNILPSSIIIID